MKNLNTFLYASLITLAVSACSSKPELNIVFEPGSCTFNSDGEQAPDWFCAPHDMFPAGAWFEKGAGDHSLGSQNLQYMVAVQNARLELGRRARAQVEENFKQFITTDGSPDGQHAEISRKVLSEITAEVTLPPTSKYAEVYDDEGNLYVLIKVNEEKLLKNIKDKENMLMREFNASLKNSNQWE